MELLELKSLWDIAVEDTISKNSIDEFAVTKTIKKDSRTVLSKIKRVMYWKFLVGGLSLIVCSTTLIGSFVEPEKFTFYESIFDTRDNQTFLITISIFLAVMLTWNLRAFHDIRHFESRVNNVKESLKEIIDIMDKTINLNIYSGVVFNSLALGWIFYLVNNRKEFFTQSI